ncbi:hypothetical protein EDB89DRAFT_2244816 [Lactarius sanguifluus]|nr:hypothetical protein EDB89DRAFT_2244816 [Lactarius sanguifluus]
MIVKLLNISTKVRGRSRGLSLITVAKDRVCEATLASHLCSSPCPTPRQLARGHSTLQQEMRSMRSYASEKRSAVGLVWKRMRSSQWTVDRGRTSSISICVLNASEKLLVGRWETCVGRCLLGESVESGIGESWRMQTFVVTDGPGRANLTFVSGDLEGHEPVWCPRPFAKLLTGPNFTDEEGSDDPRRNVRYENLREQRSVSWDVCPHGSSSHRMEHRHPLHAALSLAETSTPDVDLTSGDERNRHFVAKVSTYFEVPYYSPAPIPSLTDGHGVKIFGRAGQ